MLCTCPADFLQENSLNFLERHLQAIARWSCRWPASDPLGKKNIHRGICGSSTGHLAMACIYLVDGRQILFQMISGIAPHIQVVPWPQLRWWGRFQNACWCPGALALAEFYSSSGLCAIYDWGITGNYILYIFFPIAHFYKKYWSDHNQTWELPLLRLLSQYFQVSERYFIIYDENKVSKLPQCIGQQGCIYCKVINKVVTSWHTCYFTALMGEKLTLD